MQSEQNPWLLRADAAEAQRQEEARMTLGLPPPKPKRATTHEGYALTDDVRHHFGLMSRDQLAQALDVRQFDARVFTAQRYSERSAFPATFFPYQAQAIIQQQQQQLQLQQDEAAAAAAAASGAGSSGATRHSPSKRKNTADATGSAAQPPIGVAIAPTAGAGGRRMSQALQLEQAQSQLEFATKRAAEAAAAAARAGSRVTSPTAAAGAAGRRRSTADAGVEATADADAQGAAEELLTAEQILTQALAARAAQVKAEEESVRVPAHFYPAFMALPRRNVPYEGAPRVEPVPVPPPSIAPLIAAHSGASDALAAAPSGSSSSLGASASSSSTAAASDAASSQRPDSAAAAAFAAWTAGRSGSSSHTNSGVALRAAPQLPLPDPPPITVRTLASPLLEAVLNEVADRAATALGVHRATAAATAAAAATATATATATAAAVPRPPLVPRRPASAAPAPATHRPLAHTAPHAGAGALFLPARSSSSASHHHASAEAEPLTLHTSRPASSVAGLSAVASDSTISSSAVVAAMPVSGEAELSLASIAPATASRNASAASAAHREAKAGDGDDKGERDAGDGADDGESEDEGGEGAGEGEGEGDDESEADSDGVVDSVASAAAAAAAAEAVAKQQQHAQRMASMHRQSAHRALPVNARTRSTTSRTARASLVLTTAPADAAATTTLAAGTATPPNEPAVLAAQQLRAGLTPAESRLPLELEKRTAPLPGSDAAADLQAVADAAARARAARVPTAAQVARREAAHEKRRAVHRSQLFLDGQAQAAVAAALHLLPTAGNSMQYFTKTLRPTTAPKRKRKPGDAPFQARAQSGFKPRHPPPTRSQLWAQTQPSAQHKTQRPKSAAAAAAGRMTATTIRIPAAATARADDEKQPSAGGEDDATFAGSREAADMLSRAPITIRPLTAAPLPYGSASANTGGAGASAASTVSGTFSTTAAEAAAAYAAALAGTTTAAAAAALTGASDTAGANATAGKSKAADESKRSGGDGAGAALDDEDEDPDVAAAKRRAAEHFMSDAELDQRLIEQIRALDARGARRSSFQRWKKGAAVFGIGGERFKDLTERTLGPGTYYVSHGLQYATVRHSLTGGLFRHTGDRALPPRTVLTKADTQALTHFQRMDMQFAQSTVNRLREPAPKPNGAERAREKAAEREVVRERMVREGKPVPVRPRVRAFEETYVPEFLSHNLRDDVAAAFRDVPAGADAAPAAAAASTDGGTSAQAAAAEKTGDPDLDDDDESWRERRKRRPPQLGTRADHFRTWVHATEPGPGDFDLVAATRHADSSRVPVVFARADTGRHSVVGMQTKRYTIAELKQEQALAAQRERQARRDHHRTVEQVARRAERDRTRFEHRVALLEQVDARIAAEEKRRTAYETARAAREQDDKERAQTRRDTELHANRRFHFRRVRKSHVRLAQSAQGPLLTGAMTGSGGGNTAGDGAAKGADGTGDGGAASSRRAPVSAVHAVPGGAQGVQALRAVNGPLAPALGFDALDSGHRQSSKLARAQAAHNTQHVLRHTHTLVAEDVTTPLLSSSLHSYASMRNHPLHSRINGWTFSGAARWRDEGLLFHTPAAIIAGGVGAGAVSHAPALATFFRLPAAASRASTATQRPPPVPRPAITATQPLESADALSDDDGTSDVSENVYQRRAAARFHAFTVAGRDELHAQARAKHLERTEAARAFRARQGAARFAHGLLIRAREQARLAHATRTAGALAQLRGGGGGQRVSAAAGGAGHKTSGTREVQMVWLWLIALFSRANAWRETVLERKRAKLLRIRAEMRLPPPERIRRDNAAALLQRVVHAFLVRRRKARERRAAAVILDFLVTSTRQQHIKRTLMAYSTKLPVIQRWWRRQQRVVAARWRWCQQLFYRTVKERGAKLRAHYDHLLHQLPAATQEHMRALQQQQQHQQQLEQQQQHQQQQQSAAGTATAAAAPAAVQQQSSGRALVPAPPSAAPPAAGDSSVPGSPRGRNSKRTAPPPRGRRRSVVVVERRNSITSLTPAQVAALASGTVPQPPQPPQPTPQPLPTPAASTDVADTPVVPDNPFLEVVTPQFEHAVVSTLYALAVQELRNALHKVRSSSNSAGGSALQSPLHGVGSTRHTPTGSSASSSLAPTPANAVTFSGVTSVVPASGGGASSSTTHAGHGFGGLRSPKPTLKHEPMWSLKTGLAVTPTAVGTGYGSAAPTPTPLSATAAGTGAFHSPAHAQAHARPAAVHTPRWVHYTDLETTYYLIKQTLYKYLAVPKPPNAAAAEAALAAAGISLAAK